MGLLGPEVEAGVADDIRLCVSELVTNALRHTPPGREFLVYVLPGRDVLRVEVHDAGPGKAVWAEFKVAGMPPAARQEESR